MHFRTLWSILLLLEYEYSEDDPDEASYSEEDVVDENEYANDSNKPNQIGLLDRSKG